MQYETAAIGIVKNGPSMISTAQKNELGELFGTSTRVPLPKEGAAAFDTRIIGRRPTQHGLNNRLAGDGPNPIVTPVHPGMKSRLHIDYSGPHSEEFQKALFSSAAAGGSLSDLSNVGGRNCNDVVDIMTSDEESKKNPKRKSGGSDGNDGSGGIDVAWQRLKIRNRKNLRSAMKEKDLSVDEASERKRAKKIGKSLMKNEKNKVGIFEMIGEGVDLQDGKFLSQDLVDRYYDCYMSDTEKEN